ncbi:MAG: histidine phosphatase family protein [Leeuwenhoekiella sp.]
MKTLYLIRHAKSSWEFDLQDRKRPLAQRGLDDAPMMGKHIKSKIRTPDLILSSDAMRAKTTALLYVKALGISEEEIVLEPRLYDFSGNSVLEVVHGIDGTVDVLMLFGHNNAFTNLVNLWGDKKIHNVSTAAFTHIDFDTDSWEDISQGHTVNYIKPKHLK